MRSQSGTPDWPGRPRCGKPCAFVSSGAGRPRLSRSGRGSRWLNNGRLVLGTKLTAEEALLPSPGPPRSCSSVFIAVPLTLKCSENIISLTFWGREAWAFCRQITEAPANVKKKCIDKIGFYYWILTAVMFVA